MMRFEYKAAAADGSVVGGVLAGESREQVIGQIRAQGQIPIRIDEARPVPVRRRGASLLPRRKISEQQVSDATRELSTLLRAGVPLDRSLGILASLSGSDALGSVLSEIRNNVKRGAAFSDAAAAHDKVFGRFYVNLLRAGESAGALEIVLERLADHLDRSIEIKNALKSAMVYPAILVVVAILSILILLGYVVPQFTEMFDSVGEALPLSTRITIGVGEFLQNQGWLLAAAVLLCGLVLRRQLSDPVRSLAWHRRVLAAPLLGGIVLKIEVARFARTLATLLDNGIPLLKALTIVKDVMPNRALATSLEQVAAGLREGQSLADPLAKSTPFPAFAVHMIKVGEESGNLAEILSQVAATYDRDTTITMKRSLALLEPVLILVLGAVIAAVIISILVAILGINELVI